VEAFDTNVVVRLLVRDDEVQVPPGRAALSAGRRRRWSLDPLWVIVETAWVLRVAYTLDRAAIAAALRRLVGAEGVIAEDEAATLRALAAFEGGSADFSDYLILDTARQAEALPLWTFDGHLARATGAKLVP
jgi:predicted nucleic-acid-binding protein